MKVNMMERIEVSMLRNMKIWNNVSLAKTMCISEKKKKSVIKGSYIYIYINMHMYTYKICMQ